MNFKKNEMARSGFTISSKGIWKPPASSLTQAPCHPLWGHRGWWVQEDGDFILRNTVSVQWTGSREAEERVLGTDARREVIKETPFSLCRWWHGLVVGIEETVVLIFLESLCPPQRTYVQELTLYSKCYMSYRSQMHVLPWSLWRPWIQRNLAK